MNHATQLRLALVAPSGSGKSTTAQLLREHFEEAGLSVEVIKLAQPLYELQGMFYEQAGWSWQAAVRTSACWSASRAN